MSDEILYIENQVCFSLYRLSKLITSQYRPYLEEINLTYPQYLVMLVLWEDERVNMSELGDKLSLDTGTLSPLVKRLIEKKLVEKKRCEEDERIVYITTTTQGKKLKKKAKSIPQKLLCSKEIDISEIQKLKAEADKVYNLWSTHE
ncbi:MarR family transcriptional regulator [Halobacteriovorax vibrionivorans]|uniref:MarR family transcriptional regulator n=1 Tax=Halobacteriovorax vibrionivorans TaxID=2152716 RepID=A0ABY0IBN7_9BACT|nr:MULTISPECIES: MarR family transcriptional regulator [Halobacteriovorax]RZF20381.1 MarR family transcriptional regulator [Halobacteriovorax vibrionivorans]TGD46554.1 MarR family transcriptional regulator [Halobacteriovorax sp. Y22]